jgi:hypothetical protein
MKPYNPTVCTCIIRLSHATANFMQLVVRNWANFQLHVSHATENRLHKKLQNGKFLVVNMYKVQDHEKELLSYSMASHTMPWLGNMFFLMHIILESHQNLSLFFSLPTLRHKKLVWHPEFLPLGR